MVNGSIEVPQGTTKEQLTEIVATIAQYKGAFAGEGSVPVLTGGAKLTNTTISPVDAQLAEQDQAITRKIAQITGVPQQFLLDTTDSKYNAATVEAYGQDVVRFCFRPRLELIEAELSTKLLLEDEQDHGLLIRLDVSALTRGYTAVQMTTATQGVGGGLLTPNEGRDAIDEPRIDDPAADKLLVPTHVANVANPSATESETHAAFRPLLEDAAQRVEAKTAKAMETASKKPDAERIAYTNTLAEMQATYATESLSPIGTTLKAITGKTIDAQKIGELYAVEIRRRAAGQEPKELITIVGENTNAAA